MKELKYLITTKYKDQKKWQEDSQKGWKLLEKLRSKNLPEYKKIAYFENQFDYWEEELGINYFYYVLEYCEGLMLINLHEFELFAPESEWKELNEWMLGKVSEYITKRIVELGEDEYQKKTLKSRYIDFETLKSEFELKYFESENQSDLIKNEIATFDKKVDVLVLPEIYDQYRNYRIAPDYAKINPQLYYLLKVNNSFQYALYREYLQIELDKCLKRSNPSISVEVRTEPLTNAQIALLLHYTGVLEALNNHTPDNTVKARIISSITGVGYKGIYDPIGKVHTDVLKTKKNLIAVLKRLKESDLHQFTKDVEWDLKTAKS